ncbi:uncharacterized protein TNCV_230571 [Trichonephila clavipes]|nr:uncharacterized protein TNCV_230571 [Trichonephila clavipes]
MSIVLKLKKDELKLVAEEIGLTVPREAKRVDLKRLIEESDVFKEDYEFVKTVIEQLLEETKTQESEHNSQLELERLKLERVIAKENETHVQFASRLTTNFDYYLKLRKVTDFDILKELIISDKMFQTLDRETAAHINIRQSGDWFRPLQLGEECDLYFTSSGNSKDIALKRLESLWTRLSRGQDYQKLYRDFLKEYEELGHMTEIKESVEPEYTYYMPHHGIYRPQKSTTKLRTVFNASFLTANGKSLNSIQYYGGVIQDDLFSLLVRFRKHIYAFTADIRQMYRMIDVDVSQRPLQRILWKGDVNEPVKVYQLNTVTYGTASAPFLAMRTLKQISIDEGENFPLAVSVLCDDFYMDDVLSGANSLEVAKTLQHQLIDILQTAQMFLHKWCGNTSELIPTTEKEYDFASPEEIQILGIAWKSKTDCFNFKGRSRAKCSSY